MICPTPSIQSAPSIMAKAKPARRVKRKASDRVRHMVTLRRDVWEAIESQQRPGETRNAVIHRRFDGQFFDSVIQ